MFFDLIRRSKLEENVSPSLDSTRYNGNVPDWLPLKTAFFASTSSEMWSKSSTTSFSEVGTYPVLHNHVAWSSEAAPRLNPPPTAYITPTDFAITRAASGTFPYTFANRSPMKSARLPRCPNITGLPSLLFIYNRSESTRLNSSHVANSYAVLCLKTKTD